MSNATISIAQNVLLSLHTPDTPKSSVKRSKTCESNCVTKKECVLLVFPDTSNTDTRPSLVAEGNSFGMVLDPNMSILEPRNVASIAGATN